MSEKLIYDNSLRVERPYPGDAHGSYVLGAYPDVLEIVLLRSPHQNELNGKIYFGKKSAGPPGHVHGGCQAAVLDEMMGSCGWHNGMGVLAAKIEVEFMHLVPYETPIDLWSKVLKVDNRKVTIAAEIRHGDKTLARSSGLFIILKEEKLRHLDQIKKSI